MVKPTRHAPLLREQRACAASVGRGWGLEVGALSSLTLLAAQEIERAVHHVDDAHEPERKREPRGQQERDHASETPLRMLTTQKVMSGYDTEGAAWVSDSDEDIPSEIDFSGGTRGK